MALAVRGSIKVRRVTIFFMKLSKMKSVINVQQAAFIHLNSISRERQKSRFCMASLKRRRGALKVNVSELLFSLWLERVFS